MRIGPGGAEKPAFEALHRWTLVVVMCIDLVMKEPVMTHTNYDFCDERHNVYIMLSTLS